LAGSIAIGGGAENCLGPVVTDTPCAAGEAEADAEAAGLAAGLTATLAGDAAAAGVATGAAGRGAVAVGAAGAALEPQPASHKVNRPAIAMRKG